jgi:hypothetical protein
MKKLKIMLLSLALFAVVGGALAFKARFTTDYCVTATTGSSCNVSGLMCTLPSLGYQSTTTTGTKYCTAPYDGKNCQNGAGVACNTTDATFLATDGQ